LLDFAGVKYLFSREKLPEGSGVSVVLRGREYTIYRNEEVFSRAMLLPYAEPRPPGDPNEWLQSLTRTDLANTAFLEPGQSLKLQNSGFNLISLMNDQEFISNLGQVRIVSYENEEIHLKVQAHEECILVLTDTYFSGWTALVDGRPTEIMQVDCAFRGVVIQPGEHEVVFVFAPPRQRLILAMALISLAAVIGLLLWSRRRTVQQVGTTS